MFIVDERMEKECTEIVVEPSEEDFLSLPKLSYSVYSYIQQLLHNDILLSKLHTTVWESDIMSNLSIDKDDLSYALYTLRNRNFLLLEPKKWSTKNLSWFSYIPHPKNDVALLVARFNKQYGIVIPADLHSHGITLPLLKSHIAESMWKYIPGALYKVSVYCRQNKIQDGFYANTEYVINLIIDEVTGTACHMRLKKRA